MESPKSNVVMVDLLSAPVIDSYSIDMDTYKATFNVTLPRPAGSLRVLKLYYIDEQGVAADQNVLDLTTVDPALFQVSATLMLGNHIYQVQATVLD